MTYVGIKESLILQAGNKGPDPTVWMHMLILAYIALSTICNKRALFWSLAIILSAGMHKISKDQ